MKYLLGLVALCVLGFAASAAWVRVSYAQRPPDTTRHVVLIGASIGQAWHLEGLPKRISIPGYSFEALQVWQFDKSPAVDEVLYRPQRHFSPTFTYIRGLLQPPPTPADIVILKECSSYFPASPEHQRALLQTWVAEARAQGKKVMVATVVPITATRAASDGPDKLTAILAYNDWVRGYAAEQKLPLLDLEAAMRVDDSHRLLRDEYTIGDGSHLNPSAYQVLDRLMVSTLCSSWPDRCAATTTAAGSAAPTG